MGQALEVHMFRQRTEFVNKKVANICVLSGLMHQRTMPYSSQQKDVYVPHDYGKRAKHSTIQGRVYSMVGRSSEYCSVLDPRIRELCELVVTPFELDSNMKLTIKHFRVFGSQGYAHINDAKRTKFEPKSFLFMFHGYT